MEIKLTAQLRQPREKFSADYLPGVLYGKGLANQNLKLKKSDFAKVYKTAGESNLIDLDFGQGPAKVLIKDTQRDVLKSFFTHVDFYQVNMKEKITTEIPLHFVGESKAIKELGGVLIKDMSLIVVECLPGDLVDHIDVDISVLQTYADAIRVSNILLPKGLELVHHTDEMVAAVREPRVEEEPVVEAPVEGEVAEAGVEGAVPAEGAAPVEGATEGKKPEGKKPEGKR